tara:strand:+ start:698 stop:1027 length:330 start_codon:yes stop_codon:yes gene_type:complete
MALDQEQAEAVYEKIQQHRRDALALLGVGHFNHNRVILGRQMVAQRQTEVQEILAVAKRLLSGDYAGKGHDINRLAELLVKYDRVLANGLSTVIGFELEDLHRRENDAD